MKRIILLAMTLTCALSLYAQNKQVDYNYKYLPEQRMSNTLIYGGEDTPELKQSPVSSTVVIRKKKEDKDDKESDLDEYERRKKQLAKDAKNQAEKKRLQKELQLGRQIKTIVTTRLKGLAVRDRLAESYILIAGNIRRFGEPISMNVKFKEEEKEGATEKEFPINIIIDRLEKERMVINFKLAEVDVYETRKIKIPEFFQIRRNK